MRIVITTVNPDGGEDSNRTMYSAVYLFRVDEIWGFSENRVAACATQRIESCAEDILAEAETQLIEALQPAPTTESPPPR